MKMKIFSLNPGLIFFLGCMIVSAGVLKAQNPPVVQWANTHDHLYGATTSSHASDWTYNTINTDGGNNYVAVGYTWTGSDASGDCDDPNLTHRCAIGEWRTGVAYKLDYA